MPNLGPVEIILILLGILLLFGARKLPELARSLGRSMRIFKSEVNEMNNESQAKKNQNRELPQAKSSEEFWNSPEMQPGNTNFQPNMPVQPQQQARQQQAQPQQYPTNNGNQQ